ncbi:hypothetical protein [Luteolibacter marinus]|uniref:hypothetical protein n=1 Tax=Luteolibacter marinus TaxID=2776705 RepID=UPI00186877D1|nr:hypothetical protein [Luteolibacter marinus]
MKSQFFRAPALIGLLLLAGSATSVAEYVAIKGSTSIRIDRLVYLDSTGETRQERENQKLQQYALYSSLGGTGYALYTVDNKNKLVFKSTGELSAGYTFFPNVDDKGQGLEVHKQFNKSWATDIPDLGTDEDLWNVKCGSLRGARRLVNLREAGFQIEAAPKLSGNFTHTICSNAFGIDPSVTEGYSPGMFFQEDSVKSNFKLDVKLTDQINFLGGSLINGIFVMDNFLTDKGFVIMAGPPIDF